MGPRSEYTENGESALSEDQVFTLLAVGRRRELLRALDRGGSESTVGGLTDELADGEHGESAGARKRKTMYVSLYQTHIPRLAAAGVVVHDAQSKTVRLTERGNVLLAYLQFDPTAERPGLLSRVFRPGPKRAK